MKKILITVIILIIVLFAVGYIFRNFTPKEESGINKSPIIQTGELIVPDSYETKTFNLDNDYVTFDVKYPSFKNVSTDFNGSIETLVKTKMDEHIKASEEYWQVRIDTQMKGENIPKVPATEDKLSFFSNFTIVQSNPTYISFVLNYGGFSGGAHGYENVVTYNYDVANQKVVTLGELFPNDPDYLTYLSTTSREYLKSQFATVSDEDKKNSDPTAIKEYVDNIVSMIDSGTEPKEENFITFTFTPDKVKIYFAQYQVGPYVLGMPTVEINKK